MTKLCTFDISHMIRVVIWDRINHKEDLKLIAENLTYIVLNKCNKNLKYDDIRYLYINNFIL